MAHRKSINSLASLILLVPFQILAQPGPIPVVAQKVTVGTVQHTVELPGILAATRSTIIKSEKADRVVEVNFTSGQKVTKGDSLFQLEGHTERAKLASATAVYNKQAGIYERRSALSKRGIASKATLASAKADMLVTKADVDIAKVDLRKTKIVAPFSGTLGFSNIAAGAYVNAGDDLVTLSQLNPLEVIFFLPQRYMTFLRAGLAIDIKTSAVLNRTFEGTVTAISPFLDKDTHSVELRATITNEKLHLKPGMFVHLSLVLAEYPNAIQVPENSLIQSSTGTFVYRVANKQAKLTPVTVGLEKGGMIMIKKGLDQQSVVVTQGHHKLTDGVSITIIPPHNKGPKASKTGG